MINQFEVIETNKMIEQENLDVIQDIVTELKTENGKVTGISTKTGLEFTAKAVIFIC